MTVAAASSACRVPISSRDKACFEGSLPGTLESARAIASIPKLVLGHSIAMRMRVTGWWSELVVFFGTSENFRSSSGVAATLTRSGAWMVHNGTQGGSRQWRSAEIARSERQMETSEFWLLWREGMLFVGSGLSVGSEILMVGDIGSVNGMGSSFENTPFITDDVTGIFVASETPVFLQCDFQALWVNEPECKISRALSASGVQAGLPAEAAARREAADARLGRQERQFFVLGADPRLVNAAELAWWLRFGFRPKLKSILLECEDERSRRGRDIRVTKIDKPADNAPVFRVHASVTAEIWTALLADAHCIAKDPRLCRVRIVDALSHPLPARPSQATTAPPASPGVGNRALASLRLQEHPVGLTDRADEALLLHSALVASNLQDSPLKNSILEIFQGAVLEISRNPDRGMDVLTGRLCQLRRKTRRSEIWGEVRTATDQIGEFCFFILQSVASAGAEFRQVCMHAARRATTTSWWSVLKQEIALCVPVSLRNFRSFNKITPEEIPEPVLGFPSHWLNQEFYLDEKMERSFQNAYAKLLCRNPYLECLLIIVFLGLFISIHYVSTEIEHRALSPARLILSDPALMLSIGAVFRLTVQIIFFDPSAGNFNWYHTVSLVIALAFGVAAVIWLFLADRVLYFYTWLPPEGWGLVSVLVVCGFVFATRFIHSALVCVVVLSTAISSRFIFLHKAEYTPWGQILFSLVAGMGVALMAYLSECRVRGDYKFSVSLNRALERSDELLLNVVPDKVLRSFLQRGMTTLAETFDNVTIMFVDVVNFTSMASATPPLEIVAFLSTFFSLLEDIIFSEGMEKIKTIGDAFMATSGLPEPNAEHAAMAASAALKIIAEVAQITDPLGRPTQVRIGLHSGSCAGGVIGEKKISFDVWGDTVNIASRMQSTAPVNGAQCTEATAQLIRDKFELQPLDFKEIKGKGRMRTYLVKALKIQ